ncbi:UbiX family flavin prenyltransferase [Chengkuizengella axinellae]|uniref:Flavin prenyltransferase UbiX n=1 Tax=Chengkuizengella axinellae TaxID=3064388 RepID=A0ABT9IWU2_9BACL|nr:flavin prenyltransferase UbiX [Chengkuizengella sp. 2205SS18-9]MDP5273798.1 flavin prenyltransferase UbiX [Chengkuizengella sp. 2205SS18-9]
MDEWNQQPEKEWIIGITGASGAIYGIRLCEVLQKLGYHIKIVVTDAGWRVLKEELGWNVSQRHETLEQHFSKFPGKYSYFPIQDIGATIASGSYLTEGMVIMPCSMGTLAGISHGMSDNLMERAADVMLKEGRKLIIVPRETPLHMIHIENMLRLSKAGATMIPAMPAFYFKPKTIDDIVSFLVGKVLDSMGIHHNMFTRWGDLDESKNGYNSNRRN